MKEHPSIWRHFFKTPFKLDWVEVNGVSTRILDAGPKDAPAVVMLHGTAGSLENFCANYAEFARQFRVIGMDMLGCGWTDKPDHDYLIQDYADHVVSVMDALGIRKFSIVGVSLGSWVGAAIALAYRQRAQKLIMVAPAGIVTDPDEERRYAEELRRRRGTAAAEPSWENVARAMRELVLKPESLMDELIAVRLDIYRNPQMKTAMPHLLAFARGDQALTLEQWCQLDLPIQVYAAVDAPNMFLRNAHDVAKTAPHVEVVEIKDCDHWAQYEQPEAFNAASISFLAKE